ncbi:beta-D-glucuronidase [Pontibacillus halophilus JSM 076056 = DSM 19796]|uniref:Beta-glucuronidase n=1 Tax=Pontibacillus halophilus JSM 076056 = DSM 19796 TaxID=1385510 RepID=A0A0A5G9X8_9BACI|nr:beta-glucuronidase [Pontibacillus halophilus]KGX89966.1 beta-D-glucuronidase [Pontibacillus halophilus JSM 076056 = DSM 19796]
MLYPIDTLTRSKKNLDGVWNFQVDRDGSGRSQSWYNGLPSPIQMPVPSSYNDITTSAELRDFIGDVWYECRLYIPRDWKKDNVFLRFGAVAHTAEVWVNGELVVENRNGFLPFEAEITNLVRQEEKLHISVRVNNELTWEMLPPGEIVTKTLPDGRVEKTLHQQHDFFNYVGIHRPVYLYTKPDVSIEDVVVDTEFTGDVGHVHVGVETKGEAASITLTVQNRDGEVVAAGSGDHATLDIPSVQLWSPNHPYLYLLHCKLFYENGELLDHYVVSVGVRTVEVKDRQVWLNGSPVYLTGFGKHEDADVRGKGYDAVTNVRDFNLMKECGANSFRTSHYPYAEEILQLADEMGFLVIDETSAVGLLSQGVPATGELEPVFSNGRITKELKNYHVDTVRRLIERDRNHPCVIMWSISNEASTMEEEAIPYFQRIIDEVRALDTRPIMNVNLMLIEPERCEVSPLVDVIGLNVYFGWYSTPGDLVKGKEDLHDYLSRWESHHQQPVMITEYGVDTIAGLHKSPPVMFSEEFQVEFLATYHAVFDMFSNVGGEHIWNFADFMTKQDTVRVDGNKKGLFTRNRQPKMAVHSVRERWKSLKVGRG